jgi:hypothetical protein
MKKDAAPFTKLAGSFLSLCAVLFKVGAVLFLLDGAYLAYAIMSGQLKNPAPSAPQVLGFFGEVLFASGVVATLCVTVLTLEEIYWAVIGGAIGVVLLLGVPGMVANVAVAGQVNDAAKAVAYWGTLTGKAMILIVVCRVIYEIYRQMSEGGERKRLKEEEVARGRRKAVKIPKENVFAKCWELPFCHEAVRELCPAFKAHKSCWKFGRGCNCDPDLVETLIASRPSGSRRGARGSEAAYILAELEADVPKPHAERTIPCARCPIYTEHQRRKFKIVNPLLIVITITLLVIFYPALTTAYSDMARYIAMLISGNAISQTGNGGMQQWWIDYLDTPALQASFVIIVGLFFLSWILKVGEWLVLEKKLV